MGIQLQNRTLGEKYTIVKIGKKIAWALLIVFIGMQFIRPDVSTVCIGQAASMGAVILAGGAAGKRHALPNSRIMIHQPWGGFQGQATDIDIHAKEILRMREDLNGILSHHTGHPVDKIGVDTERDNFMSATEAVEYGLIDKVLVSREELPEEE